MSKTNITLLGDYLRLCRVSGRHLRSDNRVVILRPVGAEARSAKVLGRRDNKLLVSW